MFTLFSLLFFIILFKVILNHKSLRMHYRAGHVYIVKFP